MAEAVKPVGMNKAALTAAMYRLLGDHFESFDDQAAYAREFGIELVPADEAKEYNYKAMIELVTAIQQDAGAVEPEETMESAAPTNAVPAPMPHSVFYRAPGPITKGIRPSLRAPRADGAGLIQLVDVAGPIKLVFGQEPYGICEVTEEFAATHYDERGQAYTLERLVALIESSLPYRNGEFWRIPPEHIHALGRGGDRTLPVVRGARGTGALKAAR